MQPRGVYERLVERFLASPAYGERWGRHWLDVVRYADTAGDNSDYPIPQHYLYRNWVIQAFNEDRRYDRFVREQLAGDLLPTATPEERRDRLIATGYLANARRFGSYEDKRYQWYLTFEDTIENLGPAFLGLGLSCARCHDHKFDPITTEDYYALYGIFRGTRYPWPGIELDKVQRDLVPLEPEAIGKAKAKRKSELAVLDEQIRLRGKETTKEGKKALADLKRSRDQLAKSPLPMPMAYAVAESSRWIGNARMHIKGDPLRESKETPSASCKSWAGRHSLPKPKRAAAANWPTG